jgi:hypothetical protein
VNESIGVEKTNSPDRGLMWVLKSAEIPQMPQPQVVSLDGTPIDLFSDCCLS